MRAISFIAFLWLVSLAAAAASPKGFERTEVLYADLIDDAGIVTAIGSGIFSRFQGKDLEWWQARYVRQRREFVTALAALPASGVSRMDDRALTLMRESLNSTLPENPLGGASSVAAPSGSCADGARSDLNETQLQASLYACFAEFGNRISFEGHHIARDSAIAMLSTMQDPVRRKALFLAFSPLWKGVNGEDEIGSPYRRWIKTAAPKQRARGSDVDAAARDLEVQPAELEKWLEEILEAWRGVNADSPVEPWDYRFQSGAADRELAEAITSKALVPPTQRYYRDLGADPVAMHVLYDLDPRPGKAPVTYANYITMGRMENAHWRPTTVRISANFSDPGMYVLNMLVHETGHAVHYRAIHNRPAFMDIGDNLLCESFADVTSWDVYDPAWQQRYLGRAVSEEAGLRSQYTLVTLEVAWALFDLRMLKNPDGDPNAVWTDITHHYFHVIAHPELSWWAQRVQLVTTPGFMVNYGVGAVITADLRARIRQAIGPFSAGNERWYPWVTEHVLHWGTEFDTAEVLRRALGRSASPEALIADIKRIPPPVKH